MRHIFLLLACLSTTILSAVDAVPASPQEAQPLRVGMAAPLSVMVHRVDGTATTLGDALAEKPTVLVFYRGGWCPFCTRQLAGLGGILPDLTAAGWQVIALAPDQPGVMSAAMAKAEDGVARLSDADGLAMRAFGVAYRVDDATAAKLKGYKIDLEAAAGNDHRWLPVPSLFLIAADGTIRFVHADPDYKVRLDPQVVMAIAKTMGK